jgi:hypothetical protein
MYSFNFFKNKKIYDINNVEELIWLKHNSHINNYVFCGQRIILELEYNLSNLKSRFPLFNEIDKIYSKLRENFSYEEMNKLVVLIQKSYVLFLNNLDVFFENRDFIKEYSSMYHIIRYLEINYFMKNKISGIRYMLWSFDLVRNPQDFLKPQNVFEYAMSLFENGELEEADKILTEKNIEENYLKSGVIKEGRKLSYNIQASLLFYKYKLNMMLGKDPEESFISFIDFMKEVETQRISFWTLTELKVSEFFLEHYNRVKDEYYLSEYKKWLSAALNEFNDDKGIQTIARPENYCSHNWSVAENNIEIIREPMLNVATYYYNII